MGRTLGHFSYYESVVDALLKRGATVDLVFDEHQSRKWTPGDRSVREFLKNHPGLSVGWSVRRSDEHRARAFARRELRSFRSYLTRRDTSAFYVDRWRGYLTPAWADRVRSPAFRALLRTGLAECLLRLAERLTPADPDVMAFIRGKAPDVLVVSPLNMRFSEETDHIKAARRLGVPTAALTQTWDSLTTKGLIQIMPDRLFVWNAYQLRDAMEIHGAARSRVVVAGSPFFDKWFTPGVGLPDRETYCRIVGLDPARPILLYLGSSRNIAEDETWLARDLIQALKASSDKRTAQTQLVVRPHPANVVIYQGLAEAGVTVWPKDGALPETRQEFADMRASFLHADAAVGINTSGMIDAVLAGLPTFSVRIARYDQTQRQTPHFRDLEDAGALHVAESSASFVSALSEVLAGLDTMAPARRAFAETFARPCGLDRAAGDVIAEAVLELVQRPSAR